jgi:hypothetical protein
MDGLEVSSVVSSEVSPPHMLNAMREFVPPQAQSFVAFNRECPKSASSR